MKELPLLDEACRTPLANEPLAEVEAAGLAQVFTRPAAMPVPGRKGCRAACQSSASGPRNAYSGGAPIVDAPFELTARRWKKAYMKKLRKASTALSTGLAIAGLVLGSAGSASAGAYGDSMVRGQYLNPGEQLQRSIPQGELVLTMQTDGNLVEYLYANGGTLVCWASNTYQKGYNNYAVYQLDGNFVVYDGGGGVQWASNTQGGGGSTVDMNSLGVLYVGTTPINNGCGF
ncbi:hypothetical protein [Catenulispora subtropica]|uniref:Bulb-type lectin domain-containing protein n=1 Tax=Catenulispora subtropica TaxID=450798 RepID=A0ABN2SUY3_9ACTN